MTGTDTIAAYVEITDVWVHQVNALRALRGAQPLNKLQLQHDLDFTSWVDLDSLEALLLRAGTILGGHQLQLYSWAHVMLDTPDEAAATVAARILGPSPCSRHSGVVNTSNGSRPMYSVVLGNEFLKPFRNAKRRAHGKPQMP